MEKKSILCALLLLFSAAIWGQNKVITLIEALTNSTNYLKQRLPAKSKVIVLNFVSNSSDLSDYIIEELTTYIVNDSNLTVVDRRNLEIIRQEMDFQLSGEVSDETAQAIGKKLGAQIIITGSINAIGSTYRLRVRAIEVETAAICGMHNETVAQDSTIAALTGTGYAAPTTTAATQVDQQTKTAPLAYKTTSTQKAEPAQTTPTPHTWKIGDVGPNGGLVYYVKLETKEYYEVTAPGNTVSGNGSLPNGWINPDMEDLRLIYDSLQRTGVADYGNFYYYSISKTNGRNRYLRMSDKSEALDVGNGRKLGVRKFDPKARPSALNKDARVYPPR